MAGFGGMTLEGAMFFLADLNRVVAENFQDDFLEEILDGEAMAISIELTSKCDAEIPICVTNSVGDLSGNEFDAMACDGVTAFSVTLTVAGSENNFFEFVEGFAAEAI